MSGPGHQFPSNFTGNQPGGMRNQFNSGQMPGGMSPQMNGMPNQMNMPGSINNSQMASGSINSPIGSLSNNMPGSNMNNQMINQLNQQYNMNSAISQNQPAQNQLQHIQQTNQTNSQQSQNNTQQASASNSNNTMQSTPSSTSTPPTTQSAQQSKEFNTVTLCRLGQETVQDIVSRTQEVCAVLKNIYPPNGTNQGLMVANERKAKMQEQLRTIRILFKRLRLIYEKCIENCQLQGMEYTHIESLIPIKDEVEVKTEEKKTTEAYRTVLEEFKELNEQVVLKNRQIKEVIDHLRRIIWEINTMLVMRRS